MADIELVIKIDEKAYNALTHAEFDANLVVNEMRKAIRNGTPLPKGHGRLGDLDALETEMVNGIHAGNCEEGYEKFTHINNRDDCVDCVRFADTIIEANKESEVKE